MTVSSGGFDNATLIEVMKNHITNEVTHYKGQCYAWDVVNEGLNDDGTMRSDVFYDTIGEAYIPIAFATAAAADPDAKLYYNDYNIETAGSKSTAAQNLVKMVQAYGAKIDGVGLQAHLIVGSVSSASSMQSNLQSFVDLGVEVAYTELDIRTTTPATDAQLTQQATDYANVITACKNVAKCVGVTIWDWTDKYSWIPSVFSGQGEALPWDDEYQPKPAYWAILSAWGGSTSTSTTLATTTTKASTTTTTSATTTSTGAALYGQCGGSGWTGAKSCAQGTCTYVNDWYSQCL
jgi:endo-1,4-beta-xylanase